MRVGVFGLSFELVRCCVAGRGSSDPWLVVVYRDIFTTGRHLLVGFS